MTESTPAHTAQIQRTIHIVETDRSSQKVCHVSEQTISALDRPPRHRRNHATPQMCAFRRFDTVRSRFLCRTWSTCTNHTLHTHQVTKGTNLGACIEMFVHRLFSQRRLHRHVVGLGQMLHFLGFWSIMCSFLMFVAIDGSGKALCCAESSVRAMRPVLAAMVGDG